MLMLASFVWCHGDCEQTERWRFPIFEVCFREKRLFVLGSVRWCLFLVLILQTS